MLLVLLLLLVLLTEAGGRSLRFCFSTHASAAASSSGTPLGALGHMPMPWGPRPVRCLTRRVLDLFLNSDRQCLQRHLSSSDPEFDRGFGTIDQLMCGFVVHSIQSKSNLPAQVCSAHKSLGALVPGRRIAVASSSVIPGRRVFLVEIVESSKSSAMICWPVTCV